jgi:nucleoid-associated protein YgaU
MLVPAFIEVLEADNAIDRDRGLTPLFTVQFNPTEYTLDKGAQIAEIAIPGLDSPILQFIRGQNEKLTLDLYFDTTDRGMGDSAVSVMRQTRPFYQLVKMQSETHAPPRIRFTWGDLSFTAIVENVRQQFTLFNPFGIPLRATLSVTFREYKTLADQLNEVNPRSSDHTKRRTVRRGDTLSRIAGEEYGDPTRWREIADLNPEVTRDLRRLVPGVVLRIPPLGAAVAGPPGRGGR